MADAANEFAGHGSTAYLRMARSAAIAGLVFSVLFVIVLVLFRSAFPIDQLIDSTSIPTSDRIERGRWALYLMPFVGIAFIWFMAALNYSIGHADHRLFTTVFVASGAIFVTLIFVAGAIASAEIVAWSADDLTQPGRLLPGAIVNSLLAEYSARMAAVFCLAVSTFSRMRRMLPSWLSILGTVTGIFLLLVPLGLRYVEYVFPVWVTILSVYLLIKDPGGTRRPNQNEVTA